MNREQAQIFEGVLSIVMNAILFACKLWAGIVTGSVALMADAWHTMSDSLTSIFVVAAAKLASKKPDKEHPFGHGRWELIASLFIAFVIGLIGYEFFTDSIERFNNRESITFGTMALVITAVSILVKEFLAQFAFYLGRKYDNPVTTANGWHSRSDSLSSVVVLVGILATRFIADFWWMDSILGIFCALALFYAAFQIMKEVITKILGVQPKQELIDALRQEIKTHFNDDLKLHHFHLHDYISSKELTLHLRLDNDLTIEQGHDIATAVEDIIKRKFGMDATIHVEPMKRDAQSED